MRELEQIVSEMQVDGVIAQASHSWEQTVATTRIAFVNPEFSQAPFEALPRVGIDEVAVGKLAADHLRERGLRRVAAVAQARSLPSQARVAAFVEAVSEWCQGPVLVHQTPASGIETDERLDGFIKTLPRPVGIFCWNDESAKHVHQQCLSGGLRIPEDVALLGVDNDETICHFLEPALSSIDPNAQRIGYESAALLDRMMDGQPPPARPILVTPIGVVTRASTETLAIDSPEVVKALQYIRAHAGASLTIEKVLEHVTVSRRSLETQFKASLDRSPRSEIQRVLVDRARDLLVNTDLTIPAVARRCGYKRSNHFTTMFRKQTGQTPSAYRKQVRLTE